MEQSTRCWLGKRLETDALDHISIANDLMHELVGEPGRTNEPVQRASCFGMASSSPICAGGSRAIYSSKPPTASENDGDDELSCSPQR